MKQMPGLSKDDKDLLEEGRSHQKNSEDSLSTVRNKWPDYESMLIAEHRESIQSSSKIYDPRLSTIEIERTARISSQRPSGKAYAVSKDDQGKNMVMNLLLGYQMDNANEQRDFLIKQMMLSFWSRVYGSLYCLVPWRVKDNYIGSELNLISIWDSFPQPNVPLQDADYFVQGHRFSLAWLKKQDPKVWNMDEIKELEREMSSGEGDVKQNDNQNSFITQQLYPSQFGDKAFPMVDAYTEYRRDKWFTWAKRPNKNKGREYLLRVLDNSKGEAYPEGMLPVVEKVSIPMFEGLGLGAFQRGKSLQFGANSLINLYMSGVKSAIFPERMVNPDNVVQSSLKYGAGEFWFMNQPGEDVKIVQRGQEATSTFNAAYGLVIAAMLNQAGTTDTSNSQQIESSLGKTPTALRQQAAAQAAQDFWEQTMLESTLRQVFERWVAMNTTKLEADIPIRIFGSELEEIAQTFPDATEMFSEKNGQVLVNGKMFKNGEDPIKFDYKIETGSTTRPNMQQEIQDAVEMVQFVSENPQYIAAMEKEGNTISATELFKEMATKRGFKNLDRIIKTIQPEEMQQQMGGMPQMPHEMPQMPQFQDEEVNALAQQIMGGMGGIPT